MKIRNDFLLREIAGEYILVPVGSNAIDFGGLISTNEVGYFIWEQLKEDKTIDQLVEAVLNEFDIEYDIALKDIRTFIHQLKEHHLIDE